MADEKQERDPEKLSIELNDAFERLERQQAENEGGDEGADVDRSGAGAPARAGRNQDKARGSQRIDKERSTAPLRFATLLVALIALGGASYAAYTVYMGQAEDARRLATVTFELDRFGAQLAGLQDVRARLDAVSAELAALDAVDSNRLAAFEDRVTNTLSGITSRVGTSSQDWLLAEVEYLLRVGAQRVAMEHDARGALALFKAADDIVRDAEGIAAFDLRAALASDIARLDAVAEVDVDGIYVRLNALSSQAMVIPQQRQRFEPKAETNPPVPATPTDFAGRLMALVERIWNRAATLIDYRSGEERIAPILPPKEEYYLRQNLVLKLQMAQLGLLRADQVVYQDSLAEARSWVSTYFDGTDQATLSLLSSLEELSAINVQAEMPDVTQSLREARALLAEFHQSANKVGTAP